MNYNHFIKITRKNIKKYIRKSFIVFAFSFIISFFTYYNFLNITFAQTTESELKSQIEKNNSEIKKLEKEIADYNLKIKNKQSDASTLKNAISILETKKSALNSDIKLSEYKISNIKNNISETENKIQLTSTKVEKLKDSLSQTFREIAYTSDLKENYTFVLLGEKSISTAFDRYNQNYNLKKNISSNINYFNQTKNTLNEVNNTYKDQVGALEESKDELLDKKTLISENQKEKDKLLKDTKNQEANYQKLLAQRKKQKTDLETELANVEAKLKAFTNTASLPKAMTSALAYPVKKVVITQYFGNTPFATQNPQVYNGSGHNGMDFAVSVGTPIYSAADGVVIGVANTDDACVGASYGKWVLVKHNNGLSTLYAHLSSFSVGVGQSVTAGQKVGLSGNTGYSTGPHLHFTVYASEAVHVAGSTEYKSKACGTYMILPLASKSGYLNPLTYLPK